MEVGTYVEIIGMDLRGRIISIRLDDRRELIITVELDDQTSTPSGLYYARVYELDVI
jgi:hypothetical protein